MPAEHKPWHFGVLSFTGTGHLKPLLLLSQQLRARGHRVTFFEKPKIEDRVRQAGLEFVAIGDGASPFRGNGPKACNPSVLSELSSLRFNLKRISHDIKTYLENTPPALVQAEVNVLLINEIALTGPTVAQLLGLPYFIISTSIPHNFGWNAYPRSSGYGYSASWFSGFSKMLLEVSAVNVHGPIRRFLNKYRRQFGLGPVQEIEKSYPALAQITQLPECLDLPRSEIPANFYYTGPFANETAGTSVDFPWDKLDGRTLVYASLGTTRNVLPGVFRMIAEACQNLNLQLVISLGGRFDPMLFRDLPGSPLVVGYVPQLELLHLAEVVITHAGPNTAFESLMAGKPMIAIPLAYDQPAVAARLARLNLAEVLPVMRLSAVRIRAALTKILHDPSYRRAALTFQSELQSLGGLRRAVELIEGTLERQAELRMETCASALPGGRGSRRRV